VRILSRHFLSSYLNLYITILFASMIAILIVELLLNFDQIMDDHAGFAGVTTYLFLRLPTYYFRDLIPVASFAAAFFCVGLAARAREIMAAKTGGVSPQRMVVPILAAATVISLVALVLGETLVLRATREWNRLENPGEEVSFRRGSFWYHRGDAIYNVREADRKSKTLHGVRVFQTNPRGRLDRSFQAEVVRIDENHRWHFHDATVRTFDPSRPAAAPVVERREETVLAVAAGRDLALLEAGAQTLSLLELGEYIRARSDEGHDTARYREMLYARLADPLAVLVFAFLAIPLGLAVEQRRSLAAAAVVGIAILGLFYTARTTASVIAAGGLGAAAFGPWLVLAAFAGFGAVRFARAPR
jgi:lipopolysaccharide export system permease protein